MRRRKMSKSGSRSYFTATASKTNKKNLIQAKPMRGGIRL